jgi:hypothetical protein
MKRLVNACKSVAGNPAAPLRSGAPVESSRSWIGPIRGYSTVQLQFYYKNITKTMFDIDTLPRRNRETANRFFSSTEPSWANPRPTHTGSHSPSRSSCLNQVKSTGTSGSPRGSESSALKKKTRRAYRFDFCVFDCHLRGAAGLIDLTFRNGLWFKGAVCVHKNNRIVVLNNEKTRTSDCVGRIPRNSHGML